MKKKATFGALVTCTWGAPRKIWGARAWGALALGRSDQHPDYQEKETKVQNVLNAWAMKSYQRRYTQFSTKYR